MCLRSTARGWSSSLPKVASHTSRSTSAIRRARPSVGRVSVIRPIDSPRRSGPSTSVGLIPFTSSPRWSRFQSSMGTPSARARSGKKRRPRGRSRRYARHGTWWSADSHVTLSSSRLTRSPASSSRQLTGKGKYGATASSPATTDRRPLGPTICSGSVRPELPCVSNRPGKPVVWSPCTWLISTRSMFLMPQPSDCRLIWVPSPQSNSTRCDP